VKTFEFAILAPVPEYHLLSGLKESIPQQYEDGEREPLVAFGSMDFELFRQADDLRGDRPVEVFIYASMSEADQPLNPVVTWRGLYAGHVLSRRGRYPGKASHRPPSMTGDAPTWAVFWLLKDLSKLETPLPIGLFQGLKQKKPYETRFIPRGPLLVEYPSRQAPKR
jgi:hypothetical protein